MHPQNGPRVLHAGGFLSLHYAADGVMPSRTCWPANALQQLCLRTACVTSNTCWAGYHLSVEHVSLPSVRGPFKAYFQLPVGLQCHCKAGCAVLLLHLGPSAMWS